MTLGRAGPADEPAGQDNHGRRRTTKPGVSRAAVPLRRLKVASYGVRGWWRGPLRLLEVPSILVGWSLMDVLLPRSSTV